MKNILFYISLLSLLILPSINVSADECSQSCRISDAPAPALTEYFTNLETIKANILEGLSDAGSDTDRPSVTWIRHERNRVMAALNSLLSFRDHYGSFDYHISLPITNELPQEVRRDHDRITRETERLTQILETSSRRSTSSTFIEDVCSGVSYCSFWEETAQAILVAVIQNNQKVAQLYRASVLEKPQLATDRNFILVADDFISEIESHYNKDTLTSCSSCEWWFLDTVREAMQNISFKNSDYSEWVQKWRDAWAMLMWQWWGSNPDRAREEAQLTEDYLRSQWIESERGHIILETQGRYDAGWLSSTDPLMNSQYQSQSQTEQERQTFQETLAEKTRNDNNSIPYLEVIRVDTQIKDDIDIAMSIETLYNDQLPYAFVQDTVTQELQAHIIRMHLDLVFTANLLWEQTDETERLCDKQATGRWRCEY